MRLGSSVHIMLDQSSRFLYLMKRMSNVYEQFMSLQAENIPTQTITGTIQFIPTHSYASSRQNHTPLNHRPKSRFSSKVSAFNSHPISLPSQDSLPHQNRTNSNRKERKGINIGSTIDQHNFRKEKRSSRRLNGDSHQDIANLSANEDISSPTEHIRKAYFSWKSKSASAGSDDSRKRSRKMERCLTKREDSKRRLRRKGTNMHKAEECQQFWRDSEAEKVRELFREVGRAMKRDEKKGSSNYYQKIKLAAMKKIDCLSYNQRYENDAEVKHLQMVVSNCDALIHTRQASALHSSSRNKKSRIYTRTESQTPRFILSSYDNNSQLKDYLKVPQSTKMHRHSKMKMQQRMHTLMVSCDDELSRMREVKEDVKIFEYYCGKMSEGFANKEDKINRCIAGQE